MPEPSRGPSLREALNSLIAINDDTWNYLAARCPERSFGKGEVLSSPGEPVNEVFFVNSGCLRVMVTDQEGKEHTLQFALEGQFICDYSSYLMGKNAEYGLQAMEPLVVSVIPRSAIDWCYTALADGNKLGRLIAEYYFIYLDTRLKLRYLASPSERYALLSTTFPNIHNHVPQHMLASYLGITSVHLSRLKRQERAMAKQA